MKKNSIVLLILMLAGVVLGGFLGHLTRDISWLAWLNYGQTFGLTGNGGSALVLELGVLTIQFGLQIKITIASIIGMVLAFFIYHKL
ncbi:MAG: DUF4321 domain-containing protein [Lachnospiraceae bacterium]|nr:DUF4321 domain-containing protein [Lachnospiraceae bacterium]